MFIGLATLKYIYYSFVLLILKFQPGQSLVLKTRAKSFLKYFERNVANS